MIIKKRKEKKNSWSENKKRDKEGTKVLRD
jgi:hypothetical protein